ncbi:Poly ADP-ribose polymerase 2-A [Taenia solium]|eukprot:TsM_000736500 transcript=TsM_000736500 gene=TsM_000736500
MRVPPLISTPEAVKTELDLLKALEDIEAAFSIIKKKGKTVDMHPADKNYGNLKCEIKPISAGDKMDKLIKDYVRMTHAPTHNSYDLEVLQAFELDKSGEVESFRDYGTRRLLWHGSRITNWMGILGRGLKIAPPEAPSTGYMFGKGVYFADCASKSANYTYPTSKEKVGIMALCEVSLGEINSLMNADYNANQLPKGKHSVQGVGRNMPDPSTWITLDDGVVVPCGKLIESKVENATLWYNEFIVYDVRQIRLRYLVQLKFKYNY